MKEPKMKEPEMPECEKMAEVKEKSQAIGEFIEWLAEQEGIHLCEKTQDDWRGEHYHPTRRKKEEHYHPTRRKKEELLAKFFRIDLDKVEQERRAMLEYLRSNG